MRTSLQAKVSLFIFFITGLSLSWIGACNYEQAKVAILQSWKDNTASKMQMKSQDVSTWVMTRLAEIQIMSRTDTVRFGDDSARRRYLQQELDELIDDYASLGITNFSPGQSKELEGESIDFLNAPLLNESRTADSVILSRMLKEQQPVIAIHAPVYDEEMNLDSMLTATIPAERLFNRFMNDQDSLDDTIVVFEKKGDVLFDPERKSDTPENIYDAGFPLPPLAELNVEQPFGYMETRLHDQAHMIFYSAVAGTQWYMAALVPMQLFERSLHELFWTTVITIALAEILLGFTVFFLCGTFFRRIRQIHALTKEAAGELSDGKAASDDLEGLARSVHGMMDHFGTLREPLNALFQLKDYAIFIINRECKITYLNHAAEEMAGCSADEVSYKRTLFSFLDEQELVRRAERLSAELGVRISPDISVFLTSSLRPNPEDDQWTLVQKNGSSFPVMLNISPMKDTHGVITGYVGIARDISLYKQAENTRNRLLSIYDAAKDLIASVDDGGNIFYMNSSGFELLEIDVLNDNTQNVKQYFDLTELNGFIQGLHHLNKNGYWEHETIVRARSGRSIPMLMMLVAHKDKQGKINYSVIGREIMEQKRIQAELVEAKLSADRANAAKSLFLARMSHEIRTPLNGILGFSQLLMRSEWKDVQKEYGGKIVASSRTLLRIVNDILDFSKVEAGKLQLERTRFSLEQTVLHVCDLMSVLLGNSEVEVLIDTPEELPAAVIGDPLRLEQVMLNLCSNALKFTEQGYMMLKLDIVHQDEKEVRIAFTVEDSGIGMGPEQMDKLFQPFMQADESTSRKYGGTGLGLVISKNLIELMGGTLTVQSNKGEGSRFTFQLPFERAVSEKAERLQLAPAADSYRILLIQPAGMVNSRLRTMLEGLSLQVTSAASWTEGAAMLKQNAGPSFHLALLDMEAEDMYGIETWAELQQLLQSSGTISITLTTAFGREELGTLPPKQRPDWVLVKPISRLALVQTIRAALEEPVSASHKASVDTVIPSYASKVRVTRGRILLAEDHEMNRQVAIEMLHNEGYAVTVAENGLQLLEYLGHEPTGWELILMDIQMPKMDGYEAARIIRADSRFNKLPIIALTANALPDERRACLAAGMNGVLNKPIDMNELASLLELWTEHDSAVLSEAAAALPEIYGIHMERLADQLNGKIPILEHILHKFHDDFGHFIAELHALIQEEDWDAAQRKVHSLKGIAGNMAADRLFAAAASLELQLKTSQFNLLEDGFTAIREEVGRILHSIEQSGLLKDGQK